MSATQHTIKLVGKNIFTFQWSIISDVGNVIGAFLVVNLKGVELLNDLVPSYIKFVKKKTV